jgi:hypothetical protein
VGLRPTYGAGLAKAIAEGLRGCMVVAQERTRHAAGRKMSVPRTYLATFDRKHERRDIPSISVALVEGAHVSLTPRGYRKSF